MKKLLLVIIIMCITVTVLTAGEISDEKLIAFTKEISEQYGIPTDLFFAIGINESGFRNVRSYSNNKDGSYDIGIFQLNSKYLKYYERVFWYKEIDFNVWNERHNIEMAAIYLSHLYSYTKSWREAIAAFNTGLHGLKKYPESANIYVAKIANALSSIQVYTDEYIYFY